MQGKAGGVVSDLSAAFPLFMQKDFEVSVNNVPYEIGVDKNYPAALREMVSAAAVTYYLQNKSIDNVRRTYLKDVKYEEDPGGDARLDRSYRKICLSQIDRLTSAVRDYPSVLTRQPTVGEWIGDLTLIRIPYSFQRAFAEADKGALFEAVAVARMALEQLAWTYAVRKLDDVNKVKAVSATKSVGLLSKEFAEVGRLYGWMSNHVHWEYDAHVKVVTTDGTFHGAFFANSEFKAISYAMLTALTFIVFKVFAAIISSYPELEEVVRTRGWLGQEAEFEPLSMISRIYSLSESSPDVMTILNIVKVAIPDG